MTVKDGRDEAHRRPSAVSDGHGRSAGKAVRAFEVVEHAR